MTTLILPPGAPPAGYGLLAVAVFCYAGLWLAGRVVAEFVSPYWFSCARLGLGTAVLFVLLAATGRLRVPRRGDWQIVVSVAFFMFGSYSILFQLALQFVHAGRASMMGYTFPIWVMLLSVLLLKERPSARRLIGLTVAMAGLGLLFNPSAFDWNDANVVLGNGLLLLAALLWSPVVIHLRVHRSTLTPLQLAPWQLLLSTAIVGAVGWVVEGPPQFAWPPEATWALAYGGLIGTALAVWAINTAFQRLPPVVAAIGMLGVPVIALLVSVSFLGEPLTAWLVIGMALVMSGIALVSLPTKRRVAPPVALTR
jgi:drug/metabolite transporter (DMT)-like permease